MRYLVFVVFITFSIFSCKKEKQICVSCVGIDPLLGFIESTSATECAEDSSTAFRNAFNESERLGGEGMSCDYLNE